MEFFYGIALVFSDGPHHFIDEMTLIFVNNPEEQLAFTAEMGIKRTLCETYFLGDVLDRGTVIAPADKQLKGRPDDLFLCFLASFHSTQFSYNKYLTVGSYLPINLFNVKFFLFILLFF